MRSLWVRFRRLYPACYTHAADRQAAGDLESVINYARKLSRSRIPAPGLLPSESWDSPDTLSLRSYLARAYSALGDTAKAFDLYRPP